MVRMAMRVFAADVGRKEFQKSANGMLAGIGNRGRHCERAAQARCFDRRRGLNDRRQVAPLSARADTL
jgi:hypothetical protein